MDRNRQAACSAWPRPGARGGALACNPRCVRIFSIIGASRIATVRAVLQVEIDHALEQLGPTHQLSYSEPAVQQCPLGRPATAGSRNCGPQTGQSGRGLERQQSGVELVCWSTRHRPLPDIRPAKRSPRRRPVWRAVIGRRPLKGAHSPKRSLKGQRRLSTPHAARVSAIRSAQQALSTPMRRTQLCAVGRERKAILKARRGS